MTYMPRFIRSTNGLSRDYHLNLEAEYLCEQSHNGLARALAGKPRVAAMSVYTERLQQELEIIDSKGYSSYFLIVADYVRWAKDNGIAVGPGRGSGPCSLVGYALGITGIDPIKYGLPFERFVNPKRNVLPDFDVDFCAQRRDEVTAYLQAKYGHDRVAHLSCTADLNKQTPQLSRLVICDRPIASIVPVYHDGSSSIPAADVTRAQISNKGLVQFNAIGQPALSIIQQTLKLVEKSGVWIDIEAIPLDDNKAYQCLSRGMRSNISHTDTAAYQTALLNIKPVGFAELCAAIALSQPSGQHLIGDYINCKQSPLANEFQHPSVNRITAETYGLLLFQEQLMHIAHEVAGFSYAKADLLRRALSKSKSRATVDGVSDELRRYRRDFITGAVSSGLTEVDARLLLEQMETAGKYCFNKSHAIAWALLAYRAAWLKANYRVEYEAVA